jgi:dTDP-L-rhamnose 4-epimerase
VLASSNVCLAAHTPYRASKEMLEMWGRVYVETYGQSVISLRFSNVIGPRASELGPSPNVTAALRKCKRENGYVEVTGDGTQSRGFTHVTDIVRGLIAASESNYCGVIDLCPSENHTLNEVAAFYNCPIKYVPDRPGDIAHIVQNPQRAHEVLGWKAEIPFAHAMGDVI